MVTLLLFIRPSKLLAIYLATLWYTPVPPQNFIAIFVFRNFEMSALKCQMVSV